MQSFAVAAACALQLGLIAGCGQGTSKPTAHLTGEVTLKGQPLPPDATGTIMFRPTAKGMAKTAGVPIAAGKFDSPNTPVGEVTVYFSVQVPTGKMISDAGGPPFPEMRSIVPAAATNGVKLSVTEDKDGQNFNLE